MASSLVGQHQLTTFVTPVNGSSPIDANSVRGNDNTIKTSYDAHDIDGTIHFQDSTLGARPAAGTVGRKWLTNDDYRVFYDDGAAWQEIAYLPKAGGTVSGNVVVTGTLEVDGNFSVNTSKFTVAASTGNTLVAGTLNVTGLIAGTGGAMITGSPGSLTASSTIVDVSGSVSRLVAVGVDGSTKGTINLTVATTGGTSTVAAALSATVATFSGTATATRVIGGTDITNAVAYGVFSDASTPANNSYAAANVLSQLVAKTSALSSGTQVTSEIYHKQTAANSGSVISAFSYIDAAFTSGTTPILIANVASVEATGSGGTTTTLGCYRTQALLAAGSTVTNLPLIDVRSPSGTGTVATLVGVDVQSMTFATTTNYAIRTRINDSTFNGTGGNVGTTATTGYLYVPTCAGPPTGVPANIATGHVPLIFDITNNFLYFYNSGWKKSTVYA